MPLVHFNIIFCDIHSLGLVMKDSSKFINIFIGYRIKLFNGQILFRKLVISLKLSVRGTHICYVGSLEDPQQFYI